MRFASLEHHVSFLSIEITVANMIAVIRYNFFISAMQRQLFPADSASQLDILIQVSKRAKTQVNSLLRHICDSSFSQIEKTYLLSFPLFVLWTKA